MPAYIHILIIVILIIFGSSLLFFSVFGFELLKIRNSEKVEDIRKKYITIWLTLSVFLLLGAFSLIVFPGNRSGNKWTPEQKEEMVKKIMESSIFLHGIGPDTARLVSECFIEKYTSLYTPHEMTEQNKLSNEELSRLTGGIMVDCLKQYGLPKLDTVSSGLTAPEPPPKRIHL